MNTIALRRAFVEVDRAFAHRGPARGKQRAFTADARIRMAARLAASSRRLVSIPTAADELGIPREELSRFVAERRVGHWLSRGFLFVDPATLRGDLAAGRTFRHRHLSDRFERPTELQVAAVETLAADVEAHRPLPTPFDACGRWVDVDDVLAIACDASTPPALREALDWLSRGEAVVARLDGLDAREPVGLAVPRCVAIETYRHGSGAAPAAPLAVDLMYGADRRHPPRAWQRAEEVSLSAVFAVHHPRCRYPTHRLGRVTTDAGTVATWVARAIVRMGDEARRARTVATSASRCYYRRHLVGRQPTADGDELEDLILNHRDRLASLSIAADALFMTSEELVALASNGDVPLAIAGGVALFPLVNVRDALRERERRLAAGIEPERFAPEHIARTPAPQATHNPPERAGGRPSRSGSTPSAATRREPRHRGERHGAHGQNDSTERNQAPDLPTNGDAGEAREA